MKERSLDYARDDEDVIPTEVEESFVSWGNAPNEGPAFS